MMDGFSPVSPPKIFWNSRRRSANGRKSLEKAMEEAGPQKSSPSGNNGGDECKLKAEEEEEEEEEPYLSERRRALFEPLVPANGKRIRPEELLPPPDFESVSYPKGWLVGKKRKLVNVDVVESMRRIAVQEMNRKDREIDGLNEQLVDDGRCMERLQLQLLEERSKRANAEREKATLESQVSMLMEMLQESEALDDDEELPRWTLSDILLRYW